MEQAVTEVTAVPEEQQQKPEPPKKKRIKLSGLITKLGPLKIPALVILVAVLSIGTALVITKVAQGNTATKQESRVKEAKKQKVGKFITLDPFTVNLAGGQNYLQAAIAFEIDSENAELETELKDRKPQINDVIISILSSKSSGAIADGPGREKLKVEIKKSVDFLLAYGKIERVYFTTFIMQ